MAEFWQSNGNVEIIIYLKISLIKAVKDLYSSTALINVCKQKK